MRRVAGRPPQERDAALHVDYADVLAQAVANERVKVLREVEAILNREPVEKYSSRSYSPTVITAAQFRGAVKASVKRLWPE